MKQGNIVDETFKLPKLISDGMVLQRNQAIKIWGFIQEGKSVSITFQGCTYSAIGDAKGKWEINIPPQEAGGPYEMIFEADHKGDSKIVLKDILVGDLWLCGGQSNMELPVNRVMERYKEEVLSYENPMIRMFHVPMKYEFNTPIEDFEEGTWQTLDQRNVQDFNAVGYFFAKALFEKYSVPIGLIHCAIGGTLVQTWMSEEALEEFPVYLEQMAKYKEDVCVKRVLEEDAARISQWYDKANELDLGLAEEDGSISWYDTAYEVRDWKTYQMPNFLVDPELSEGGFIWFRKEIEVLESMAGKAGRLLLGTIVDNDIAYINGIQVGTTPYRYPPRIYSVSEGVLKKGKNSIVVRVGFERKEVGLTPGKRCGLEVDGEFIDLAGAWQYKIGAKMEALMPQTFLQYEPTSLYKGMLYPLKDMGLKGVIWYQGESNTHKPEDYKALFEGLIKDWRRLWQRPELPFLYVQLPGFATVSEDYYDARNWQQEEDKEGEEVTCPQDLGNAQDFELIREADINGGWAMLRQAQLETLEIPHTAMVVALDTGEWNDLHPLNKKDIGQRLARAARAIAYDEDIAYSSPLAEKASVEDGKVVITFRHVGGGLMVKGKRLNQFIISEDGVHFYKAQAALRNNEVIVWHNQMKKPIEIRYAWADNPVGANLYSLEGLPAAPFAIKIS